MTDYDYTTLPGFGEYPGPPYFPGLYDRPNCGKCEYAGKCPSYGKYQRDKRDFTVTSGRCPRLPNRNGWVSEDFRQMYQGVFPLAVASKDEPLYIYPPKSPDCPVTEIRRRIYYSKGSGFWFRGKRDESGRYERCYLRMERFESCEEIRKYMAEYGKKKLILRVEILS